MDRMHCKSLVSVANMRTLMKSYVAHADARMREGLEAERDFILQQQQNQSCGISSINIIVPKCLDPFPP